MGKKKSKPCKQCGTVFTPERWSKLYCSETCAVEAGNDRSAERREREKEANRKLKELPFKKISEKYLVRGPIVNPRRGSSFGC